MTFPGILLAKKWTQKVDPKGWWMSEKLDGVRAYWNGERFVSRTGKPSFNAPEWFTEYLPKDVHLDGELFVARGQFKQTVSACRKQKPRDHEWAKVTYQIFDAPTLEGGFETRLLKMCEIIDAARDAWKLDRKARNRWASECPYYPVMQTMCKSAEHLAEFQTSMVTLGAEGTMLRQAKSAYARSRSSTLLKVKDFHDEEATVVSHKPGAGKHDGRMGALYCVWKSDPTRSKQFKVGTGFDDSERDNAEKLYPAGTTITFRYQEIDNVSGKPRFPSFVAVRDYE